ncbi:hypothetical protein ACVWXU_006553 [Streptomyces sp. TE33382]
MPSMTTSKVSRWDQHGREHTVQVRKPGMAAAADLRHLRVAQRSAVPALAEGRGALGGGAPGDGRPDGPTAPRQVIRPAGPLGGLPGHPRAAGNRVLVTVRPGYGSLMSSFFQIYE